MAEGQSCVVLDELLSCLISEQATSTSGTELCAVCQHVGLVNSIQEKRPDDDSKPTVLSHWHLGSLQRLRQRSASCPGCRIILSASEIVPLPDVPDPETTFVLIQHRLFGLEYRGHDSEADALIAQMRCRRSWAHCCTDHRMVWTNWLGILEVVLQPADAPGATAGVIALSERQMVEDPIPYDKENLDDDDSYRTQGSGRRTAEKVNIDRVKEWLAICTTAHADCRIHSSGSSQHTIRAIDVQEKRVVTASTSHQYVALSYVWGEETAPLLTRATLTQYSELNGLDQASIPQTIEDAMQFVKDIGLRYLWVDSLCIVQDDAQDKNSQLPLMSSIYGSVNLVVVAAAGTDAESGLPGIGETSREQWQQAGVVDGKEFITVHPSMNRILSKSSWNTRGWTFQEAMLSRRCIVFTPRLVYWSCHSASWREDLVFEIPTVSLQPNFTNSLWGIHGNCDGRVGSLPLHGTSFCRSSRYLDMVQRFCARRFKEESDTLWAFMGVMGLQVSMYPRGFVWGHPYEALDVSLLWHPKVYDCGHAHFRRAKHRVMLDGEVRDLDFPTWSWLSPRDAVTFPTICGEVIVSQVTWHDTIKVGADERFGWDDMGESSRHLNAIPGLDSQLDTTFTSGEGMGSFVMDYGLLHFTAKTAELVLRVDDAQIKVDEEGKALDPPEDKGNDNTHGDEEGEPKMLEVTIHNANGPEMGRIKVLESLVGQHSETTVEFVLLSSNAHKETSSSCGVIKEGPESGDIQHVKDCEHVYSHNIMLIVKSGNAYTRQGLATVVAGKWVGVETAEKDIILA
ncbi:uncharacterized protein E0L32_003168 [Thyridium curvatum]|uniref:Heterokaryon incompatibility domain-containing protein n=1 Tax=Thyridium curvatum TaxID=1093900 RepID=A0A507B339_9PEZI|nr:uncharacterized protein E0L32_003168 [Thyridium curvatum]TPX17525.1 hypothetical protein E0L32_003168 [Thyridium curvatum]